MLVNNIISKFVVSIVFVALTASVTAQSDALTINSSGDIGMGTDAPDGQLHLSREGNVLTFIQSSNDGAVQMIAGTREHGVWRSVENDPTSISSSGMLPSPTSARERWSRAR